MLRQPHFEPAAELGDESTAATSVLCPHHHFVESGREDLDVLLAATKDSAAADECVRCKSAAGQRIAESESAQGGSDCVGIFCAAFHTGKKWGDRQNNTSFLVNPSAIRIENIALDADAEVAGEEIPGVYTAPECVVDVQIPIIRVVRTCKRVGTE